jgi:protein gp37
MEQKWAEDVASDCEITGTKFWMKQMGARTPEQGAQLIPAHLLIRQFPGGTE